MNKLKTDIEGKFPFVLDDLRFQAEGMKKALANLAKGFGDKVILWGLTANATHNLEGAVFINDEIFKFEQSAILTGNLVLKIAETYDENGYKEFPDRADGDKLQNTYAVRKVVMKSYGTLPSSLPADEFLFSEFSNLSDFNNNSAAINAVNARIVGITETLELTDSLGNDKLRLDVENGLIKRKWYSSANAYFLDEENNRITEIALASTMNVKVFYAKGEASANSWTASGDGRLFKNPAFGSMGITEMTITQQSGISEDVSIDILEGSNVIATLIVVV